MNTNAMDLDPLSNYDYPMYNSYPIYCNLPPFSIQNYPPNHVKLENSAYYNQTHNNYFNNQQYSQNNDNQPTSQDTKDNSTINDTNDNKDDIKEEITKKRTKKKKEKSTYCSEKIKDSTFKFYGCSICNISFGTLTELDEHVTIHKDRMTSYRLRLKNKHKKKLLKKEKKKLKKLSKVKQESADNWLDFEIKPEEGYIGTEKACDYSQNNDTNSTHNGDNVNTVINSNNTEANSNPNQLNSGSNGIIVNSNQTDVTKAQITKQYSQINDSNVEQIITKSDSNGIKKIIKVVKSKFPMPIIIRMKEKTNNGNNSENNDSNGTKKEKDNDIDDSQKIYKCFACQKQFALSYYLKLHVRSHTDEKPYVCNVCGQSFITASKLGRHNKRIHLSAKFQCRICFKIFIKFDALTAHFDKKHPEDKLEGEPYDYNAILPYLKELEDQFKLQEENKPKSDDLPLDGSSSSILVQVPPIDGVENNSVKEESTEDEEEIPFKYEYQIDYSSFDAHTEALSKDITVDTIKMDAGDDDETKVKTEVDDEPLGDDHQGDSDGDDVKDGDIKAEDSDSDYFPSNTWTGPAQSPVGKRTKTKKPAAQVCEICNKHFSSVSYMRIHLRTHTGEKPYKCYICGRGFITSSKMNRHVLTHKADGTENLPPNPDKVKGELTSDVDDKTEQEDALPKIKKKRSKSKKGQSTEGAKQKKAYNKRPHKCEFCNLKFLHLDTLEVHRQSHAGETAQFKCTYCLEECPDEEALLNHERQHSGPRPYLCTLCGRTYTKKETMVYHRKHHKTEREFVCEICSKCFNAASKLQKHMVTHSTEKFVLRYECPVCAHMFNTKYHITMHLSTHQKEGLIQEENRNEVLAMVLQNARKIPKQPDTSKNLSDIIPSDERSRICNICGEIFHHFYYLEEHLKSHGSKIAIENISEEEEKKYICPICSKGFKLHYYLKLHSFTHSKEKPYQCHQCTKGFITKGKLKRHLETHTGLKKYQCHICYKFFTRPSYLRIHIRTIHGAQDYNFKYNNKYMGIGSLSVSEDGSHLSMNPSPR